MAYTGRLRCKGLPFLGFRFSYFEKGCRIKCATTPKCIMGGLEFIVFQRNLKQCQERPWTYACECYKRKVTKLGSTATVSGIVYWSYTFRDCHMHIFSDNLSRNSCIRKGSDFTSWNILKGREICHLGLLKGPIELIDEWHGFEKSRKRSVFEIACSQPSISSSKSIQGGW